MPKKFASLLAPACFAFLLFAAAGSASAQASCDPDTDPNQCVVTGGDPGAGPHAIVVSPISNGPSGSSGSGSALTVLPSGDPQSADNYYAVLLMLWGLS